MERFTFTIGNPSGLTMEAAGKLVEEAIRCTGKVMIRKGEKSGDAKLIFHVMSLSLKAGEEAEITVEGEKEQSEASCLEAFIRENI